MNRLIRKVTIKLAGFIPKRQAGQTRKEYQKLLTAQGLQAALFVFAALAIVRGAVNIFSGTITVSNSVNGRELPIYCVETKDKEIALSFDAAWGNS